MKEVMIASVKFGSYRHCLWWAETKNLIKEQPDRFVLIEGKKCEVGTMYFCKTYLEAKFVMSLEKGVGLYTDENPLEGNPHSFVVCTRKKFAITK